MTEVVIPFERLGMHDVETVGGKNASIGEMIASLSRLGVKVPGGFATTAAAYRVTLAHEGLDERIRKVLADLDVDDVVKLAEVGAQIRSWILAAPLPPSLEQAVREGYRRFGANAAVAVRSSATAEDLPEASFAGQQETYLNERGIRTHTRKDDHYSGNVLHPLGLASCVRVSFSRSLCRMVYALRRAHL